MQHVYVATSGGGRESQSLSLIAPVGQYAVTADGLATVRGVTSPLTCALKLGPTILQSVTLDFDPAPVEFSLQGAGVLSSGSVTLSCSSHSRLDSVRNLSLMAYVASAIN